VIHPLLDAGEMPHLQSLIERGVMGMMKSLTPQHCPLLWASALTGHTADRHGVLSHAGGLCHVKTVPDIVRETDGRKDAVFTAGWPSDITAEQVRPDDLTGEDLLPFVPELHRVNQKKDRRLVTLAMALAETINTHLTSTMALEQNGDGFFAFRYGLLENLGAEFMQFHPPQLGDVADDDFRIWSGVIAGAYRFLDMALGRLVQLAGPDAHLMLVSDHGFESGALRPSRIVDLLWRRGYGIFCMAGPDIRGDEIVYGVSLLDVAPTLLTLLGLPVGLDMKGRVPADAFVAPPLIGTIPTHEAEYADALAARLQLVDLGYLEADTNSPRPIHELFSLVQVHLTAGRAAEALPMARELVGRHPKDPVARTWLAVCCLESGLIPECREIASELLAEQPGMPNASAILAGVYLHEKNPQEALRCLVDAERRDRPLPLLDFAIARSHLAVGRWRDAETWFRIVLDREPDHAPARIGLAEALVQLRRFDEASEAALDAIVTEFDQPQAHYWLGMALAQAGDDKGARQAFTNSRRLLARAHHDSATPPL